MQAQGRLDEAEKLLRQALDVECRVLGEQHPDIPTAMNNLALVAEIQGKYAEAEELFRRALEMDQLLLGDDHPRTQIPFNNLLRVLRAQGKMEETRPYVTRQLASRKHEAERPGADPITLNRYAWLLLTCDLADLRDPETALPIAKRAVMLDGRRDANILDTLAVAYQMTGDLGLAIETQKEALALPPRKGVDRAVLEKRLSEFLLTRGDLLGAAEAYRARAAKRLAEIPFTESAIGTSLVLLGQTLAEQHNYAGAEPFLRECLEIRQKALPEGHWLIADTMSLLGATLARQGEFEEAEPLLVNGYAALTANPNTLEDRKGLALERLVELYEAWGKPDRAAEWDKKLAALADADDNS
jgi:tetratricopeptide (TPR) repeat protein